MTLLDPPSPPHPYESWYFLFFFSSSSTRERLSSLVLSSSLSEVVNRLISWRVWSIWKASLRFSGRRFPSPALLYTANFVIRVLLASYLRATSTFNTRFVLLFYLIELLPPRLLSLFFFSHSSFFLHFFFFFSFSSPILRGSSLCRDSSA